MTRSPRSTKAAVAFALACSAPLAGAVQILDGADGHTLYAKVSKKEITRLALDHGRITTLRFKQGELGTDPDEDTGQLFLSVPPGSDKPINAFLTTDAGATYTLVMQVVDAPADSIVIRQHRPQQASPDNKAGTYDRAIKRLAAAMAGDGAPDDMQVRRVGRRLALWREATATLDAEYLTRELVGERYLVTNVSNQPMVLDEREFYRKGVSVVALDQLNLAPGASTRLYVVREKAQNE